MATKRNCLERAEARELAKKIEEMRQTAYNAGKEKDYHQNDFLWRETISQRGEIQDIIAKTYCENNPIGNPPLSPYHHKTEYPGMPGHHRLSGSKRKFANALGAILGRG